MLPRLQRLICNPKLPHFHRDRNKPVGFPRAATPWTNTKWNPRCLSSLPGRPLAEAKGLTRATPSSCSATWVAVRSHALCTQHKGWLWLKSDLKMDPEKQLPEEKLVRTVRRRPWRPGSQFPRPGKLHAVQQLKNAPHRHKKRIF